jgi:hypothetical protein
MQMTIGLNVLGPLSRRNFVLPEDLTSVILDLYKSDDLSVEPSRWTQRQGAGYFIITVNYYLSKIQIQSNRVKDHLNEDHPVNKGNSLTNHHL